jgi:hypothetical protein
MGDDARRLVLSRRARFVAATLAAAGMAAVATTHADVGGADAGLPERDALAPDARRAFEDHLDAGKKLLARDAAAAACSELEAASAMAVDVDALVALANCYLALGRRGDEFGALSRAIPEARTSTQREQLAARRDALRASIGMVTISSTCEDPQRAADVAIDGRAVSSREVGLEPGRHVIEVSCEHAATRHEILIAAGQIVNLVSNPRPPEPRVCLSPPPPPETHGCGCRKPGLG